MVSLLLVAITPAALKNIIPDKKLQKNTIAFIIMQSTCDQYLILETDQTVVKGPAPTPKLTTDCSAGYTQV
jgi:hypothetical protein